MHHTLDYFKQYLLKRYPELISGKYQLINTHDLSSFLNRGFLERVGLRSGSYIFHRNEPGRAIPERIKPRILFDCLSQPFPSESFHRRIYAPLGAVSFSVRSDPPELLRGTLAEIRKKRSVKNRAPFGYLYRNLDGDGAVLRSQIREHLSYHYDMKMPEKSKSRDSINLFDDATRYYEGFEMGIAFENRKVDGYISEKIFNVILAGTIPVYYGTERIFDYINRDCVIYYDGSESTGEFSARLINTIRDKGYVSHTLNQKILRDGAFERLFTLKDQ